MTVTVREALASDLAFLVRAEAEIFSDAWSEDAVKSALDSPVSACLIAECDGSPAGYLLGSVIPPEGEVLRVATLAPFRRAGVGHALLTAFSDGSRFRDVTRVLLEVRAGNSPALRLYRAFGFVEDAVRKDYYKDPKDDAVLMSYSRP